VYQKNSYPSDPTGTCEVFGHQYVGQTYDSGTYAADQLFFGFDTSIPADVTITGATLHSKLYKDGSDTNFIIRVRSFDFGPSIECPDWRTSHSSTILGTYATANLPAADSWFDIYLNNDSGYSWLNRNGSTRIYLTSDREECGTCKPAGWEWVELEDLVSQQLIINYTTPSPPTPFCGDRNCNGGETCSSCPADCGVCPTCSNECSSSGAKRCAGGTAYQTCGSNYDADTCLEWSSATSCPSGQTCSGSGVCSTSGGGDGGKDGTIHGILNVLQIQISVPHLIGNMKIPVKIGSFTKEIEVSPDKKDYSLDVKEANIPVGSSLTIVVGGNKTLLNKTQVTPNSETTAVNVGDKILGDITGDNKIDDKDAVSLLDSIAKQTLKGDLNADKATNSLDWAILLANFGKSGDL